MAREQRKLAAILAADVVGYARLMGRDESGTLARLKMYRNEHLEPTLVRNRGRLVKLTGDGVLSEFPSAVDALRAAIEFQQAVADANQDQPEDARIVFRIGLHLGDLIVEGDDLYGDGVNIAARLEAEAAPGGILISRTVHEAVEGRLKVSLHDLGALTLKNIERPVRAFKAEWNAGDWTMPHDRPVASTSAAGSRPALALPDKPSIAVLPFQNMSGDPEQEYFADGMVEEITTALSRIHWLFVIARNSSFTYKGRAVDIKQVGGELGVQYVLEGSVRKGGDRIRITGQLIDASTGAHLWADHFDGTLADVFDLQDRVAARVVGAIEPKLQRAEIERSSRKPTENLNAYDYLLRGVASLHQDTRESNAEALAHFGHAINLDPSFAAAFGLAARAYTRRQVNGWMADDVAERREGSRLARRAAALGRDDAVALSAAGVALAILAEEIEDGAALIDQALLLDPNMAAAWHFSALTRLRLGEAALALDHEMRAMRLSPLDPLSGHMQAAAAQALLALGRRDEAWEWARRAVSSKPNWIPGVIVAATSAASCGRLAEARDLAARLRVLDATLRTSNVRERMAVRRQEHLAAYQNELRRLGVPD